MAYILNSPDKMPVLKLVTNSLYSAEDIISKKE
nr:MAG TPA: hypothetical protein [Caudoviricetes sp.]